MSSNNAGYYNQLSGTIAGTQSQMIDTSGHQFLGLILAPTGTLTPGTITFEVGFTPDTWYPLYTAQNTLYSLPHDTGARAWVFSAVETLVPYRYIRIKTDVSQTGRVILPVKIS